MFAQRWYTIKYTVPNDTEIREMTRAFADPRVFKRNFQRANPSASIVEIVDRHTGTIVPV